MCLSIGGENVNSISTVLKFTAPSLYSFSQTDHIYTCFLTFNIFQNILDFFWQTYNVQWNRFGNCQGKWYQWLCPEKPVLSKETQGPRGLQVWGGAEEARRTADQTAQQRNPRPWTEEESGTQVHGNAGAHGGTRVG